MDKRDFLRGLGASTLTTSLAALLGPTLLARHATLSPSALSRDEEFWSAIRARYRLPTDWINLENGYYSIMAQPVLESLVSHAAAINQQGSRYMRTRMEEDFRTTRAAIARVARCPVEELALTRNTTESLDLVIAGHDWKAGDEVVFSEQDYGTMQAMFEQQAARHGIVCKRVSIPLHPQSDAQIVGLYASAFTERTRLVMVPHMINLTGQILPVQAIAAMARARNVAVMVDGAHAFAHIDFGIPELGCDYYAASLHKWLGCPLGAGLLWVRRDRIAGLWPLLAPPPGRMSDDITRLNHLGTHPVHTTLAIREAIAFHEELGIARKEARLRHLQQYWTSRVRQHSRIRVNTPLDPGRHCGIGNVGVEGLTPKQLETRLLAEFGIYTVGIDTAGVHGVRVTPHVYTSEAELERLVKALETLAG